jgi:hypothetical protein
MSPKYDAFITVKTQFMAQHRWPDAPPGTEFLRNFHRHVFVVKATARVSHGDRDIEFFALQDQVFRFCQEHFEGSKTTMSCEMFAERIMDRFPFLYSCSVSEDDENMAVLVRK